ncbi:Crotonase [Burkholderiales bacterium 8X]|nr:Crotonase [Burkholderiales bacterium 8X]
MTEPKILVDVRDHIMRVSLNRPEKLNAIDNDLARQLLEAVQRAESDEQVRVLMLRGTGRAFCAGRDVGAAPTDEDLVLVQSVASALVQLPKPVVAAVHGWTVGAGFEWMLDADLVIAAENTRFKLPEASLGVFVTGGLTATLPSYAGLARAKGIMLLGEEFSAAQAEAWGLVWRVAADDELDEVASQVGNRLASLDPVVVRGFKKVLNEVGLESFGRAVAAESAAQTSFTQREAGER